MSEMRIHTIDGKRLYLNAEERAAFLDAAALQQPHVRLFGETLHYTGCRISEALELTPERIDLSEGRVLLRSLKKRREDIYRAVPVPERYMGSLELAFGIRKAQKRKKGASDPLWSWTRRHGWKVIKDIMIAADIVDGPHRTPKGLRHGYGMNAIQKGVPLHMLQKWMGHAQLTTTAIYANASGREEEELANRMWEPLRYG